MRRLLLLAVTAGLLVLTPGTSWACSCVMSTTAGQVQRAETVVDGTVEWIATNGVTTTYSVKIDKVYKGKAALHEKLVTSANEASCGLGELSTGKRYLFFVHGIHPGRMRVDLCGGSTTYDAALAGRIQAITGVPTGPVQTPASTPVTTDDSGTSWYTIVGIAGVGALVIGGVTLLRRRTSAKPWQRQS